MDPIALSDQLKAEIGGSDTKGRADIALAAFMLAAKTQDLDVALLGGFTAVVTRQEVVFERLAALDEKIDKLAALIVSKG